MKNRKIFVLSLALIVFASACISEAAVFQKKFGDYDLHFRGDLSKAEKVSIYPSEDELKSYMFNKNNYLFYITYIQNETENGFYAVSGSELSGKLVFAFKKYYKIDKPYIDNTNDGFMCLTFGESTDYGRVLCIKTIYLNSTDDLSRLPNITAGKSVIFMKGPGAGADETSVVLGQNGIITLSGKDFSEKDRKYTDLDLAVDKFVTLLLEAPPAGLKEFGG